MSTDDLTASSQENIHYRHSNFTQITLCHWYFSRGSLKFSEYLFLSELVREASFNGFRIIFPEINCPSTYNNLPLTLNLTETLTLTRVVFLEAIVRKPLLTTEAAIQMCSFNLVFLNHRQNHWKTPVKEFIFRKVADCKVCSSSKIELLHRYFSRILL